MSEVINQLNITSRTKLTTKLARANKLSGSLRTTVPSGIIKQFELNEGDNLYWKLEPRNDELIVVIRPFKT